MANQVYITVYTDESTLAGLDAWASEERRSRNNLIQLIIEGALRQREERAAQQSIEAIRRGPGATLREVCMDMSGGLDGAR